MTEELLYGADIIPGFQEVRGEAMAQRVRPNRLRDPRLPRRRPDRLLQGGFVQVMPARYRAPARVGANPGRREDPLPAPFTVRIRVFPSQRIRQQDTAEAGREVAHVLRPHALQVHGERFLRLGWQHRDAIPFDTAQGRLVALPLAHEDLVAAELDVFHA